MGVYYEGFSLTYLAIIKTWNFQCRNHKVVSYCVDAKLVKFKYYSKIIYVIYLLNFSIGLS